MNDSTINFLPRGAIIQRFEVNGLNIVQGFNTTEQYAKYNKPYFGEVIGRVANRISEARIDNLNNQVYSLTANNGTNNLHGGPVGWGKRDWLGPKLVGQKEIPGVPNLEGGESVQFSLTSQDGDQGFPGTVKVKTTYTTGTLQENGKQVTVLGIDFEAELVGGADETVINMTNHTYWNLTGEASIEGTKLTLATANHLLVNDDAIPTGQIGPFPFNTTEEFTLGVEEHDLDHCFVFDIDPSSVPVDTRSSLLKCCVRGFDPRSGVHLEVLSTEPAFQVYTGQMMDVAAVDGLPARGKYGGFAVEPGRYTNAINEEAWKSMVLLKKGQTYGSRIVYKAWKE